MSKIGNDNINLKVGLDAVDAQKKIHELAKATEQLSKQNQQHRKRHNGKCRA
jgi:hypothetical protein